MIQSTFFSPGGDNQAEKLESESKVEIINNGDVAPENEDNVEKKKKKRNKKKGNKPTQTDPPSIPIIDLFPDQVFPVGQIMEHPLKNDDRTAKDRFTSEEKKALDRMHYDDYNEIRLAAEAHRQVSSYLICL